MSEHPRADDSSPEDDVRPGAARPMSDDDLARRITRALRSREAAQPDAEAVAARLEARLALLPDARRRADRPDLEPPALSTLVRRGGKVVAIGVVTSALAVTGAGAAAAANPYSDVARVVESAAHAVGVDWSAMPAGYTRAEYEAFWGAGYTAEDADALSVLWKTDLTEAKATAGQMLLDGETVPIAPGSSGTTASGADPSTTFDEDSVRAYDAFWAAGYTDDDLQKLSDLWHLDLMETKARAGQMIIDGRPVPVVPSGRD